MVLTTLPTSTTTSPMTTTMSTKKTSVALVGCKPHITKLTLLKTQVSFIARLLITRTTLLSIWIIIHQITTIWMASPQDSQLHLSILNTEMFTITNRRGFSTKIMRLFMYTRTLSTRAMTTRRSQFTKRLTWMNLCTRNLYYTNNTRSLFTTSTCTTSFRVNQNTFITRPSSNMSRFTKRLSTTHLFTRNLSMISTFRNLSTMSLLISNKLITNLLNTNLSTMSLLISTKLNTNLSNKPTRSLLTSNSMRMTLDLQIQTHGLRQQNLTTLRPKSNIKSSKRPMSLTRFITTIMNRPPVSQLKSCMLQHLLRFQTLPD